MAITIQARHIQNFSAAESLQPHWGYADRVMPCVNDALTCSYLDLVYDSHDASMLYSGILWITIFAIVFALAFFSRTRASSSLADVDRRSIPARYSRAISASLRKRLLPDGWHLVFGRATRLQITVLLLLTAYLTIWSFAGLTYSTWLTPVMDDMSDMPGMDDMPTLYNTRTTLGPWANRIGVLAFALTPLAVLLGNRESLLSVLTGIPYQKFNFLHRWLGWIIFAQSALHTIGWCVTEIRLYQPQPETAQELVAETYIHWGIGAMALLTVLVLLSTPWGIRLTGYEFFRKAHYVLAMVFIGGLWGHWDELKCFLLPSLLLWFADRAARMVRTALLHYQFLKSGNFGFEPAQASITAFRHAQSGDVLRLDFELDQDPWHVGQHYFLCFPECSIWQSHPFTPLNAPQVVDGKVKHSYILRAKGGETKKLADLATSKAATAGVMTTPVVLTGAYGERLMDAITPRTNVVCIAGGTGITYVLPPLLALASQHTHAGDRQLELIWAVRHADDLLWAQPELDRLRRHAKALNLTIRVFATRDCRCAEACHCGGTLSDEKVERAMEKGATATVKVDSDASSSELGSKDDADAGDDDDVVATRAAAATTAATKIGRPDVAALLDAFLDATVSGATVVLASGPGGMLTDARSAVAGRNDGGRVLRGHGRYDVKLICDDRLEY